MRRLRVIASVLVFASATMFMAEASACPNCKEAVANQQTPEAAGLRAGYFWSIILMISMPIGLLSTGAFMITRAVKRGGFPEF